MAIPETTARSRAKARGYRIEKSRQRSQHSNNRGLYQLIDNYRNEVVLGINYDATLDEINEHLMQR